MSDIVRRTADWPTTDRPSAGDDDGERPAVGVITALRQASLLVRPTLRGRSGRVLALGGVSLLSGAAEAGVLALVAQAATAMVTGAPRIDAVLGPVALDAPVGTALALAFSLAVVRLGLQVVVAWLPSLIAADVQSTLRRDLFISFSGASWKVQADERDGHLQELMGSQVSRATQAVLNVASMLSAGAMFATLAASALLLSVPVAMIVLASAGVMFMLLRPLSTAGRTAARDLSDSEMAHAEGISESVRMAEEANVFGTVTAHRERVAALIAANRTAFFKYYLTGQLAATTYQSASILLIVAGLAGLYATDSGSLATLGAAVLMLVRAATYGQQLQGSYHGFLQTLPYLDRIDTTMQAYRDSSDHDEGEPLPKIRSIGFQAVSFSYRPARQVLRDVDLHVDAGEAIGVVGPSGSGKSTLVQILLRLRTPTSGALVVNDIPVSAFSRADWQRRVAYVPQEPRVFRGTVADNIRYFRDLDDLSIAEAARSAHVHDDILAMPMGFDTIIGQRADAVSGGQRQRICVARALAAQPDVLILDEPTSALDASSEAGIQASLSDLHGKVTMFVVAHRISTLSICDRVLVLGDGTVEAFAPASELVRTNAFFRHAVTLSDGSS